MSLSAGSTVLPANVTLLPGNDGNLYSPLPSANGTLSLSAEQIISLVSSSFISTRSRLNWIGELSMFVGIAAGVFMGLTGLTSVPCITPHVNWREWRLLQSHFGWACVLLSTVHVLLLGAPAWPRYSTEWPAMIPTITLVSVLPAMLVLAMKIVLVLPPVSMMRKRVLNGTWKGTKVAGVAGMPKYAVKKHA